MLLLQKVFMATMKDPDFLTETKEASLIVNPIDGPTISKIVADLYTVEPRLVSRFRQITEVTPAQK
jgi:hypothetical protein